MSKAPYEIAFSTKNIKSSFKSTGIFPFNRAVYTDDDFVAAYVTDLPAPTPEQKLTPEQNRTPEQNSTPKQELAPELQPTLEQEPVQLVAEVKKTAETIATINPSIEILQPIVVKRGKN